MRIGTDHDEQRRGVPVQHAMELGAKRQLARATRTRRHEMDLGRVRQLRRDAPRIGQDHDAIGTKVSERARRVFDADDTASRQRGHVTCAKTLA